jgi:hypothetical protein
MKSESQTTPVVVREVDLVELASLAPHPDNYRTHTGAQLEEIMASIKEHGFYRALVVSSDNVILAGHGVAQACEVLGIERVPIMRMPYEHDDPRAMRVLVGDNYLARLSADDSDKLTEILTTLNEIDAHDRGGIEGTGFDVKALAKWKKKTTTVKAHEREVSQVSMETSEAAAPIIVSRPNDCWAIGDHRIMVGDAHLEEADLLIEKWEMMTRVKAVRTGDGVFFSDAKEFLEKLSRGEE